MSSTQCQNCGSTDIDTDPSRGDSVCTQCGSVLEDSGIVTEVQFAQDSRGVTRAVGQLVSSEDGMPRGLNLGHRYGLGRESRAITLQNARQNIQTLASKLNLNPRCVDQAFGFYKVALSRQLTKGRKSTHVIAACVYMVCRKEETPHMLLDLSDILQISVYELGKTYLKLSSALCINSPAIDPSLYILRFAHQLQFDKKTHEVAMTASRLVQRMKKDWMHTGRRPSGLCGAALLVASRLHNFNRSVDDIIKVVKVCQATVRKRLAEFSDTPSSRLTLDEFMTIDLEEEQDPPAFKNNRKKLQQELEDDGKMKEIKKQVTEIQRLIEKALESTQKRSKYSKMTGSSANSSRAPSPACSEVDLLVAENTVTSLKNIIDKDVSSDSGISQLTPVLLEESVSVSDSANFFEADLSKGPEPTAESIGLKDSIEDCMKIPEPSLNVVDDRLDTNGLDDEELDNYLMDPVEYQKKDVFWHQCNADYLEELKEKEERRAREEEENANRPDKKKKRRPKRGRIQASTTGEAIEKMLQQKKISFKLNYEVLKSLNPEDAPSEATVQDEKDFDNDEIAPIMRRNTRVRIKSKPPALMPLNIKKGMSDIIGNSRKKEMLAAMAEQNFIQEPPEKKIKQDNEVVAVKDTPLETIILDENNQEAEEEIIEEEEEEEYESDEDAHFSTSLLNFPKEEKAPDYYECDEYVDDYDD